MRESLDSVENVKNSKQSCWQVMAVEVEQRNEQKPDRGSLGEWDEDENFLKEVDKTQERVNVRGGF